MSRLREDITETKTLRYEMDQETFTKILNALVKRALEGDVEAAKFLLQRAGF